MLSDIQQALDNVRDAKAAGDVKKETQARSELMSLIDSYINDVGPRTRQELKDWLAANKPPGFFKQNWGQDIDDYLDEYSYIEDIVERVYSDCV